MVEATLVAGGDVDVVLDGERQSVGAALLASARAGQGECQQQYSTLRISPLELLGLRCHVACAAME